MHIKYLIHNHQYSHLIHKNNTLLTLCTFVLMYFYLPYFTYYCFALWYLATKVIKKISLYISSSLQYFSNQDHLC